MKTALCALHDADIPLILVHSAPENVPCLCRIEQDVQQAGPHGGANAQASARRQRQGRRTAHPGRRHAAEQSLADALDENLPLAVAAETKPSPKLAYMNTRALLSRCPGLDALVILCGCVPEVCRAIHDANPAARPALLCFENSPEIAALLRSGAVACAVSCDAAEQGRLAMRLLFEHLVYERKPEQSTVCTPSLITPRGKRIKTARYL